MKNSHGRQVGMKNSQAILNDRKVREIRKSSKKSKDLASHYGVSQAAIMHVRSGRRWSHVK